MVMCASVHVYICIHMYVKQIFGHICKTFVVGYTKDHSKNMDTEQKIWPDVRQAKKSKFI